LIDSAAICPIPKYFISSQNLLALRKEMETIRFKCEAIEHQSELGIGTLSSLTHSFQVQNRIFKKTLHAIFGAKYFNKH
jgi:hypothetical protein